MCYYIYAEKATAKETILYTAVSGNRPSCILGVRFYLQNFIHCEIPEWLYALPAPF